MTSSNPYQPYQPHEDPAHRPEGEQQGYGQPFQPYGPPFEHAYDQRIYDRPAYDPRWGYGTPQGYGYPPPPPPARPQRRDRRHLAVGFGAGALAAVLVLGGVALAESGSSTVQGTGRLSQGTYLPLVPGSTGSGNSGSGNSGSGSGNSNGSGNSGPSGLPGGTSGSLKTASATQQVGVVTIVSVLKYQNAESAGTGMILTSNGEILTNNHVINGATSITVTVESTGHAYRAAVVGTAPTKDVALLQLKNASGLSTAKLATDASAVQVGDKVTGVGNAGGTGTLTQAAGAVTGLGKSITASDEGGGNSERLHDLIETDAGIISGDSGGPLYDSSGEVVGMDTAASQNSQSSDAYAIPIENAISVVHQIQTGVETTAIHIGLPGFLGIGPKNVSSGVSVESELRAGPARSAGIGVGSVITSINGTKIKNVTQLHDLLSAEGPGAQVTVDWTTRTGNQRSAQLTLATGPAD